jgi:predicted transcriptional regulator
LNTKPEIRVSDKEDEDDDDIPDNKSIIIKVVDIMHALSDNSSLLLLDTIAIVDGRSDLLISKLSLTRKQFYSKMSCLMNCGLVNRRNGRYVLTSFGKIIHYIIMNVKRAAECYSKLKVIDLLETSNDHILKEEFDKIADILLEGNPQIRQIVVAK